MRLTLSILCVALTGCLYAGPLAGGGSEIREGAFPDRVARFLSDAGGARSATEVLPTTAQDSGAIYLLTVDQRALGLGTTQVAVVPRSPDMPSMPADGWKSVDGSGVFAQRLAPGEYVVYVRDSYHWPARRAIHVRAMAIDTLLAVMRTGAP